MKKYIFNNLEYTNLNDLGLAYIENFDLAVKDLKTNSVKLLSFIKTKNKKINVKAKIVRIIEWIPFV